MKKILELHDIMREFQMGSETVRALKGVSFDVFAGEFVTIMGSSGSGKTTLLNTLGCLDKPSSGTYLLDGVSVREQSRDQLAKLRNQKIGFVFQAYNLLPRTTALENVELPLFYNPTVTAAERRERAAAALQAVKLGDRINHMPNEMSGGQQQRVAIARALVNEPVMILADEATGNLDTRTSYEIMALMQDLNQNQGKTIVFVTHEPDIAAFSSRTITLRDGRVVKDQVNQQVRSAKEMLAALPETEDYHV
ncbi:ABC transporter ATP-binding protein [Mucilaginibacter psychrotolerans]|nr:ABC transporter ATP-binding protein [Mucilaginibacter psychrotolerans]